METYGASKRLHVDTQVTIEHQCSASSSPPTTGDIDPPQHPDISMESAVNQTTRPDIARDDEDFVQRHRNPSPDGFSKPKWETGEAPWVALSLDLAVQQCMFGWPPFDTLYGHPNNPTLLLHGVFAEMPFGNLDPKHVFIRDGNDPVVRALHEVQADEVPPETFRMCDSTLGLDTPLRGCLLYTSPSPRDPE